MKDELGNLLQKEMDRKQFLKHVAIGVVSITGIATVVKTMNGFGSGSQGQNRTSGYGSAVYGGRNVAQQTVQRYS